MATEVCINITKLIDSGLSMDEYVFCSLFQRQDYALIRKLADYSFVEPNRDLDVLVKGLATDGWVKIVGPDIYREVMPLTKFTNLFKTSQTEATVMEVESWIDEYRMLFKGLKPGAMGDKHAILDKMQKFIRKNPQFTKEKIIEATKRYIDTCAPTYQFLMFADYFIYKQDSEKTVKSRLLGFLEDEGTGHKPYDKVMMI